MDIKYNDIQWMFTQEQWMDTLKALQKKKMIRKVSWILLTVLQHWFLHISPSSLLSITTNIKKSSTILSIRINISFKYLNWIKKGLTALPPQSHISTVSDSIFSFTSVPRSIDSKFLKNKWVLKMGKNDTIFDKIMFSGTQGGYSKVRHNTAVLQWVESQPIL